MPKITITFADAGKTLVTRSVIGTIGMILKDTAPSTNPVTILDAEDIPSGLSADSVAQIKSALIGYNRSPKAVIVYATGTDAADYSTALSYFEGVKIDYLVAPTVETDGQVDAVKSWVIDQRKASSTVKAVLPNCPADNEGIVNFATESCTDGTNTYTAEQMCARIAGILASTPLTMSATYAPLEELTGCTKLSDVEMDKAIDAGKLIVFWDGEKVKIARAVNSLTTLTDKSAQWQKCRVVQIMDMIRYDITTLSEDYYIGKYSNSYDNKCILLAAVQNYFDSLVQATALADATVSLDVTAIKAWLHEQGIDTSDMTNDDIKRHTTGDYVFLTASITILDAIEDIVLNIAI